MAPEHTHTHKHRHTQTEGRKRNINFTSTQHVSQYLYEEILPTSFREMVVEH